MSHRTLIRELVAEVRRLREEIDALDWQYQEIESHAHAAQRRAARMAESAAEQAREMEDRLRQAEWQEIDRRAAMRELEQAQRYDNEYAERRAMDKLKRLS